MFGRFLSTERDEPPDIDVDFEHERREEVMQYVYEKYGGNHTGLTANVICYRSQGRMREVAKVFGLSDDTIDAHQPAALGLGQHARPPTRCAGIGLDPDETTLGMVLECASELHGFPRHLSQHVGGFVITRDELDQLVPISKSAMDDRTIIEWNKDDIDALGILKVDVLALGMLTCLRRAFELMHVHYEQDLTMAELLDRGARRIPKQRGRVYEMTHRADTIGVFQIESRAQMSMLPRLKPDKFYDLVIEVAIVRPGPIQGGMVHPYLKRRLGMEQVELSLARNWRRCSSHTSGVPLFQEQAMQIAIVGAGFTPGEADKLRRSMATFKRTGGVGVFRDKFIERHAGQRLSSASSPKPASSRSRALAPTASPKATRPRSRCSSMSRAGSNAITRMCSPARCSTASRWGFMRRRRSSAMPSSMASRCAGRHQSLRSTGACSKTGQRAAERVWDRHREMRDDIRSTKAIRLGFASVKGLKEDHANILMARRGTGYGSVRDLWLRTGLPIAALEKLAEADAFQLARAQPAQGALGGARADRQRWRRDAAAVQPAGPAGAVATRPIQTCR